MTSAPVNLQTSDVPSHVLDLQQLLNRCLGSLDLAERCLVRFEHRLKAELEVLQDCVESENREELARTAHRVKGAAATVAAGGLATAAAALEAYGRGTLSADANQLLSQFRAETERFLSIVPRFSQLGQPH